jgi:serine protease AprX
VLLASYGVAQATADELPTSGPDVYIPTVGVQNLHSTGFDGSGTTVAIIDTGVADVPALDGVVIHQENISSAPDEGDQFGHGTFVAGLVHETAPGAKIVSIKLSDGTGAVDVTQVLAALSWVIANKDTYSIDVVNLSFGNDSKQSAYSSPLNYAVQKVWDSGIVVVASAGNLGDQDGTVTKPGDDPLIISTGASDDRGTTSRDDDTIPAFGSRGPTQDGLTKPDIVAPGTRVVSLRAPGSSADVSAPQARIGTDHFRGSGTSCAAPIVAGVAAIMLDADPGLDPDQVKYGLRKTATAIDGFPTASGKGTVRAMKALGAAREGRANGGVQRSSCNGIALQAARGSAIVEVEAPVILETGDVLTVDVPVLGISTGEAVSLLRDAPDLGDGDSILEATDDFNVAEFCNPANWDPATWSASQWGASQWGASHWGASQWGASHWGASHWGSTQWWASQWG